MFSFSLADQEHKALDHVWSQLSADLQIRVIGLVAQLALNVVVVRFQNQSEGEEQSHVEPSANPQDPS
jgi:hypothetical protein